MFQRTQVRMEECHRASRPGTKGHEETTGWLGEGFPGMKAVREGKRQEVFKRAFRVSYFRGGTIWGLAMGVAELERSR